MQAAGETRRVTRVTGVAHFCTRLGLNLMHEPPTEKQLTLLARLKYCGPLPETAYEASTRINELKEQKKLEKMSPVERKAYQNEKKKREAQEQRAWLRERRADIREQIREDLRDDRENEREMAKLGNCDPRCRLAGWLLRIGPDCTDVRHLNGLLVTVEDARTAISARDVPKGTRSRVRRERAA
jgi:hypothetical protein